MGPRCHRGGQPGGQQTTEQSRQVGEPPAEDKRGGTALKMVREARTRVKKVCAEGWAKHKTTVRPAIRIILLEIILIILITLIILNSLVLLRPCAIRIIRIIRLDVASVQKKVPRQENFQLFFRNRYPKP